MPFGTDVGIIAFMMLFIFTIYIAETRNGGTNAVFRMLAFGMSVYMLTTVESFLGMIVFIGFGAYNLLSFLNR